jgi:hypothetical protein
MRSVLFVPIPDPNPISASVLPVPHLHSIRILRLPRASYDAGAQAEVASAVRQHPGALVQFYGVELCSADPATPLELQGVGNRMMLDYYRDLAEGCVAMRRCRLMLLGSGAAGKTTLGASLVHGGGVGVGPGLGKVTHGVEQRTCISPSPES